VPEFVPERFAGAIARAARWWNVSAALISAQLYAESNFNPFAHSPAGAQGIAQFMPAPVAAGGCVPPYPETRAYVAKILGLLDGAGEPTRAGLEVKLVEWRAPIVVVLPCRTWRSVYAICVTEPAGSSMP